ncbi:thioredoxin family protein [Alkalicoccobacillus murimartini]|uniref:Thiol-disulfide isomerase/thioredoxin n=1 Tax=Alkalicoccobacillus murimartini TaxID=171685 RepID=A0ABT9YHF4_9BACI|nr:thioredoxin family protein [Alkalicoccobacillus murimartini]MDQ0207129.1 thiol-disulfide isomerase/thioredoxin [Alkalicoccobacillus murimartini]
MKKILVFGSIIVVVFALLALLTITSNKQKMESVADNQFGKDELTPATMDIVDDPNYQNAILPEELQDRLDNEETFTVYFYASDCPHCKEATPRLVDLAEELDEDIPQYNLREFEQGWSDHNIESTPTLVHYKDGVEEQRIVGAAETEIYEQFLTAFPSE